MFIVNVFGYILLYCGIVFLLVTDVYRVTLWCPRRSVCLRVLNPAKMAMLRQAMGPLTFGLAR